MSQRAQRKYARRAERNFKEPQQRTLKERLHQAMELRRSLQLVWQAAPETTLISIVLMLFLSAIPVLILYTTKLTIDEVTTLLTLPPEARDFNRVVPLIALIAGVALVEIVLNAINRVVSDRQTRTVKDHVIDLIHKKSLEVDLEYYENAEYRDTLHRVQTDAPYRPPRIVSSLMSFVQNTFSLISLLVLLISFSPIIALVLFASAIPGLFARVHYARVMFSWLQRRAQIERVILHYNYILAVESYAKEIRLFDLGRLFARRHHDLRAGMREEEFVIQVRGALRDFVAQFAATAAVYGSYAFIAYQTVMGAITLGSLVMYFQAFQRGQSLLRDMLTSLADLYEHTMFLTQLYEFLEIEGHVVAPVDPKPVPNPMQQGIEFKNVSFHYPNSERPALENISLRIRPGEVIALVGENGAGKTTLIKLLCRLYDPTEGTITLDGIDLRCFDPVELRQHISAIFQDFSAYQVPVFENIGYGDVKHLDDREKIIEASKRANAHPVVESLPQGYDTMLGKWFLKGEELSVGQWQKIALARLFMRDAQLMVLDEPTSALDVMSEYEVFERFRQVISGRSAVLISHRLSTIKMAHNIYVLDNHKIVEVGSHDDLMQKQGIYAKLFETQSQYYR